MLKLHLGCGTRYLDGYVNIDHPPSNHSVQSTLRADIFTDILMLQYAPQSVDEIRLHHVFEHFPRPNALALLCRWRTWLKPGGTIRIETPDVAASARALAMPWTSRAARHEIVRHLFGSHEAVWAAHWDGWYGDRFRETLSALGFERVRCIHTAWGRLRNVEVLAVRGSREMDDAELEIVVTRLLRSSLVTFYSWRSLKRMTADSEIKMLDYWLEQWRAVYKSAADKSSVSG